MERFQSLSARRQLKIFFAYVVTFLLPSLIWGQTGTLPRQVEAVDTISTGESLPSYEDWVMLSRLDTLGLDDYRYHHARLATIPFFRKDADSICWVFIEGVNEFQTDTFCVIDSMNAASSYSWFADTDAEGPLEILDGNTLIFSDGTGMSVTRTGNTITFATTITDTDSYIDSAFYGADDTLVLVRWDGIQWNDSVKVLIPTESYSWDVDTDGELPLTINNTDQLLLSEGTGMTVDRVGNTITFATTIVDTDTYIDSARYVLGKDTLWLLRWDGTQWADSVFARIPVDHDWYEIEQQAMPGALVDSITEVIYTKQNVVLNRDSLFTEGVELEIHPRPSEEGAGDASELATIKMYGAEDSTFVQIDAIKFGNYAQMEIVTQSGFQVREYGQTGQFVINNDAPPGSIIVYPTTGELQNEPYGTGTFANNDATYIQAWDVDGNVLEVSIADLGDSIALASDHDWYEIGTTDSPNNIADSMYNLSNRIRIGQDSLQDDLGSTTANVMIRGGALPLSLQSSTPNTLRFLQTNGVQDTTYFMDIVNQEGEGYIRGGGGGHIIQWHGAYADAVNPALLVDDGGDLRFSLYPNTRNDAGNPVNVLTTDATGGLESHPVADLNAGGAFDDADWFVENTASTVPTASTDNQWHNGNIGIGDFSAATIGANLDIVGTTGIRLTDVTTDATVKNFIITGRHYTNAEEDVFLFGGDDESAANQIQFGGGNASFNAATDIFFYTGADNTTLLGTQRMRIDRQGDVGIGSNNPLNLLHLERDDAGTAASSNYMVNVENPNAGASVVATLGFQTNSTWRGSIQGQAEGTGGSIHLITRETGGTLTRGLTVFNDQQIGFPIYGGGTYDTGAETYLLGVETDGDVVEVDLTPGGGVVDADWFVENTASTVPTLITNDMYTDGNTGFGDFSSNATVTHRVDIVGVNGSMMRLGSTVADLTQKEAMIEMRHRNNGEEDILMFYGLSNGVASQIHYGGSWAGANAATQLSFWTAANNTTLTGTERFRIRSNGTLTAFDYGDEAKTGVATSLAAFETDGDIIEVGLTPGGGVVDDDWLLENTVNTVPTNSQNAYRTGYIGIGDYSASTDLDRALDIIAPNGTQFRLSSSRADATTKNAYMQVRHYLNAEEDVMFMLGQSLVTTNNLLWGGGSGLFNAATNHRFYTAANNTTLIGTERFRIDSDGSFDMFDYGGLAFTGTATSIAAFDVNGNLIEEDPADYLNANVVPDSTWRKESDNSHAFGYEPIWRDSSVRVVQWFEGVLAQDSLTSTRLAFPKAGSQTVNGAGAIRIDMPSAAGWDACEVVINLRIREDLDDTEYDISLAGSIAPSTWSQASATVVGTDARQLDSISFGSRQTDVLPSIWLEDTSGSWTNANVTILDVIVYGTNRTIQNWRTGWNIVLDNSTTGDVYQENRNITQILPEAKTDTFRTSNDTLFIGEDGDFVVIPPGNPTGVGNAVAYFDASGVLTSEAGFHYVETTDQFTTPGKSIFGNSVSTGVAIVEIGEARSGVGDATLDFHTQIGNDWDARIYATSTGNFDINNNSVSGATRFYLNGAYRFQVANTGRARLHNYTSGTAFNFADVGMIGFTSLGELNTMSFQEVADSVENLIASGSFTVNSELGDDFTISDGQTLTILGVGSVNVTGDDTPAGTRVVEISYNDGDASATNELQNLGIGTRTSTTYPITITSGTGATLGVFTSTLAGLAPSSGGGTTNFLRADGTWAAPPGGSSYDLDYSGDTGSGVITNAETFNIAGGNAITTSVPTANQISIAVTSNSINNDELAAGTAVSGQILSSTGGDGLDWINAPSGSAEWTDGGAYLVPADGSAENVGIGMNTAPGAKLEVLGNMLVGANTANQLIVDNTTVYVELQHEGVGADASYIRLDETGGIQIFAGENGADLVLDAEDVTVINSLVQLGPTTSEQLEINNWAGGVFMEREDQVDNEIQFNDANIYIKANDAGDFLRLDGASGVGVERDPTTYAFEVTGDAWKSTGGTSWQGGSDRRIKERIKPISDAYTKILGLNPVTFHFKEGYRQQHEIKDDRLQVGWIGQEYENIFPHDVTHDGEYYEDYKDLINMAPNSVAPYTVAAVQQLIKDKREMETRIDYLEQQIQALIQSQKGKK